jgi:hypothetical protein
LDGGGGGGVVLDFNTYSIFRHVGCSLGNKTTL